MVIMLVITWRTSSLRYLLRAGSYWNTWGAGPNWGRLRQTGTELHRLGGLPRAVSSVKQKGWFADWRIGERDRYQGAYADHITMAMANTINYLPRISTCSTTFLLLPLSKLLT